MSAFALRGALMRSNLSLAAKAVGVVILDHQGRKDGVCKLTVPKLADACGVSPRQAKRATRELRDGGWLVSEPTSPNRATRRLVEPSVQCHQRTPVPKREGDTSGPLGCQERTPRVTPADPAYERTSERISETTTPPLTPPSDDDGFGAVEARREEWRSAIVQGWHDRHAAKGGHSSVSHDRQLMTLVMACDEWAQAQPPGSVDIEASCAGMLDRFFAAKAKYRRLRLAWLLEDVGRYLDPPEQQDDSERLWDGSRRRTARRPACQLTEADIDNSHSESIFGSVELPPKGHLSLVVGGNRG